MHTARFLLKCTKGTVKVTYRGCLMCKNFEEGGKGPGGNNGAKWKRGKERRKKEKEMKK